MAIDITPGSPKRKLSQLRHSVTATTTEETEMVVDDSHSNVWVNFIQKERKVIISPLPRNITFSKRTKVELEVILEKSHLNVR